MTVYAYQLPDRDVILVTRTPDGDRAIAARADRGCGLLDMQVLRDHPDEAERYFRAPFEDVETSLVSGDTPLVATLCDDGGCRLYGQEMNDQMKEYFGLRSPAAS